MERVPGKSRHSVRFAGIAALLSALILVFSVSGAVAKEPKKPTTDVKARSTAKVDLNAASQKELEALPGVGAATAKKIIANRPYQSADELSKAGLSAKKIDAIKPLVSAGPAPAAPAPAAPGAKPAAVPPAATPAAKAPVTTAEKVKKPSSKLAPGQVVNINTASKQELEALPGIGPSKAQAIIDGRPYNAAEDIMKVKGIKQGTFNKIKDTITVR